MLLDTQAMQQTCRIFEESLLDGLRTPVGLTRGCMIELTLKQRRFPSLQECCSISGLRHRTGPISTLRGRLL